MSIEYRDIMQCEQLNELPDGAYVVVIDNGDMKIISKADAGLGRVPVTEYELIATDGNPKLQKADGTEPSVQEVYDALKSGVVLFITGESDGITRYYAPVINFETQADNGVVKYICMFYTNRDGDFKSAWFGDMVVS